MGAKSGKIKQYKVTVKDMETKFVDATSPIDAIYKSFNVNPSDIHIESVKYITTANTKVELIKGMKKSQNLYNITFVVEDEDITASLRMRDITKRKNIVSYFIKEYSLISYDEDKHIIQLKKSGCNERLTFIFNTINTFAKVMYVSDNGMVQRMQNFEYADVFGIRKWYETI